MTREIVIRDSTSDIQQFLVYLQWAATTVGAWPEWKQVVLGTLVVSNATPDSKTQQSHSSSDNLTDR